MLSQPELDSMHARFWMRRKITFSADVMVSDQVLSRLAKELSRRQLTVADLGKLKTLYSAICSDKKRKRVAVDLYFEEESDVHNTTNTDVHEYLAAMYSLCIGLAVAGSQSISSDREPRGSDTTKFVECPLDILLRYHHRAAVAARSLPYRVAITWLRERDIAERAIWVEKHRQTQQSLGVIVKDTYQETASLWVPPPNLKVQALQAFQPIKDKPAYEKKPQLDKRERPQERPPQHREKPAQDRRVLLEKMNDGRKLCKNFQLGKCDDPCKNGELHICADRTHNGRACGMQHQGMKCMNKR
jgi:hypothetical protein